MSDSGSAPEVTPPEATTAIQDAAAEARKKELAENLVVFAERGWNNPVPFNYSSVQAGEGAPDARDGVAWLGNAAVYEWDDEFGDVAPRNEALERELFLDDNIARAGGAIKALEFHVDVMSTDAENPIRPVRTFEDAGLHPVMLDNVKLCKYTQPTPIQCYTIPAVLTGHDVVAIAQTGSGKTAAYLLPVLSKLMGKAKMLAAPRPNPARYNPMTDRVRAEPLVLVVCPTRELACQIFDEARRLCYRTMLRPCVIYGGAPSRGQRESLEMGCDVLIATPGRLMDFIQNDKLLSFHRLKFTIIDEADELLSAGWEEAMERLFNGPDMNADSDHTYMMFSATFPKEARRLAREYMDEDYVRIKVGRVGSTHKNITQSVVYVEESQKDQAVFDLIKSGPAQRTLVFVNTKVKCDSVDDFLYNRGLPTTSLHSDRTQREREDALRSFRTAKAPILIATGVSARGLDVANVKHIINYDLPSTQHDGITEYIHRIGRTARIGNEGMATSFYNERNEDIAEDLVKILLESEQQVPDFLQDRIPEDPKNLEWHDGTDDEDEDGDAAGFGGGFGDASGSGFDSGFGDTSGGGFDSGFGDNSGDASADAGDGANKFESW